MRKSQTPLKTLFALAALCWLAAGVVQGQVTRYELVTVPEESARMGGLKEAGGTVFLNTTTAAHYGLPR